MARVRIKNIDGVTSSIKKIFNDTKTSQRVLLDIGNFTKDRIVATARTGKSLEDNERPKKFPGLKPSTKKSRKSIAKNRPERVDREFFRPGFANVTLTGQLLKSLTFKISPRGLVTLFFKDKRKPIYRGEETSNNSVYDNLKKLGFGFLGLDEKGQKRVKKIVLDEFRRNIKKIF